MDLLDEDFWAAGRLAMAVWTLTNAQGTAWSIEAEVVRPTEDDLDFKNGQGEIVAVVSRSGIVAIREDAKVQHQ